MINIFSEALGAKLSIFYVLFIIYYQLLDLWNTESTNYEAKLEGSKEGVVDLSWDPIASRKLFVTVTTRGTVCIWRQAEKEHWSAYAPGFKELDENTIYHEREDEFGYLSTFNLLRHSSAKAKRKQ